MKIMLIGVCAITVVGLMAASGRCAERMIGVVPTDGSTMLVKEFEVEVGTTILGVRFENNDAMTTFPEMVLVRGPLAAIADGDIEAGVSNMQPGAGLVTVLWPTPILVLEAGTYFVGVRFPQGPGKQGLGNGPAIGANPAVAGRRSFVAPSFTDELIEVPTDLAMTLLTSASAGSGPSKAGPPPPDSGATDRATLAGPFLRARSNIDKPGAEVSLGMPRPSQVLVALYDVAGRLQRELFRGDLAAGTQVLHWDGRDEHGRKVPTGVYFLSMRQRNETTTAKLIVTH